MQPDKILIDCREAKTYLPLFIEDELDHLRSTHLKDHLSACESCRSREAELASEQLWILENAVRSPTLPANFAAKVSAEIRRENLHQRSFTRRLQKVGPWAGLAAAGIFLALLVLGNFPGVKSDPTPADPLAASHSAPSEATGLPGTTPQSVATTAGSTAASTANSTPLNPDEGATPVLSAPSDQAGSGKEPAPELAVTAPEVSPHGEPITTLSAGLNLDMGMLFGLFARRYENTIATAARPIDPDDPCLDDLNDDGKVDGGDVAYGCLLLLEAKPSAPERDSTKSGEAPDCDNREPCV